MGLIHDVPSAQDLIARIVAEAEDIIKNKFGSVVGETIGA